MNTENRVFARYFSRFSVPEKFRDSRKTGFWDPGIAFPNPDSIHTYLGGPSGGTS